MVREDDRRVIVATCARGRAALVGVDGVLAEPLSAPCADVLWRRDGVSGAYLAAALTGMPDLRWLHTDTAGVDELPLADLAAHGVTVTKTSAYTEAVAEWIVTAVCMAAKGVPAYVRASDAGEWQPGAGGPRLLAGSQAVVVGEGEIGSYAGAMLRGMGVSVELVSRALNRDVWPKVLLPDADWLVLACPLTAETRGLIGTDERCLKDGAWIVNVARGGIVDEAALAAALDLGQLGGAVLDTFDVEPLPPDSPLRGRPDVIVLPHDAWRARGAGRRQVDDFLEQLQRYRTGQPLRRTVDTAAGY